MVLTARFKKFLEVIVQLPRLALEIALGGHDMLLVGVICFLVVVVVAAGCNCDSLEAPLLPLWLPLMLSLAPLPAALDGAPRLLPGTIFPST
jgi:hypothetical protein